MTSEREAIYLLKYTGANGGGSERSMPLPSHSLCNGCKEFLNFSKEYLK